MSSERQGDRLHRVGAMWQPRSGAKSLGSGTVTVNGLRQRFVVLHNERKKAGSNEPDYVLMSSDEPEVDTYVRDRQAAPVAATVDESPF